MRAPAKLTARTLLATALAALMAVAAGCGDDDAKLPVRTIYLSVPQQGRLASRGDDMEDAAKLALDQSNYDTPDVRIELKILNSANEAANLERAWADKAALAYVYDGDLYESGGAMNGVKRFGETVAKSNAEPLLGVSLAPAVRGSDAGIAPGLETIHLLPSAADSGAALAQAVAEGAPEKVTLNIGDTPFARHAAAGFRSAISETPIELVQARSGTGINAIPGPGLSTVYGADRPQSPNPSSEGTLVTPALPPAGYPPNGEKFHEWFEDAYGRKPDRWAIWAYEAVGLAMNAITDAGEAIGETGSAGATGSTAADGAGAVTRQSTRAAAFALSNRFGPVGHYDVLPDGQTTLYTFAIRPWPLDAAAEAEEPRVIEVDR